MALAHCAALSSYFQQPCEHKSIITRIALASLSSPLPLKPTKRKNHLRPKLFTIPSPITPTIPKEPQLDIDSTQILDETQSFVEQEVQVSAISEAEAEAESEITTRSVMELVFYLVGFFIVQTIITVWVMRSNDKKSENQQELELSEKKKVGFWDIMSSSSSREVKKPDDSLVYVNELQMNEKIVEIRAMARDVRRDEAKKVNNSSHVIEFDEDVVNEVKTNIQKEVDGKLSKLEKRLRSLGMKSLISKVKYLNGSDKVKDKKGSELLNAKVEDENLVFKKKLLFGNVPKRLNDAKGFGSDKSLSVINGNSKVAASQNTAYKTATNGNDVTNTPEKEEKSRFSVDNYLEGNVSKLGRKKEEKDSFGKELGSTRDIRRKLEIEGKSLKRGEAMKIEKTKPRSGHVRESNDELVEAKHSSKLKTDSSPIISRGVGHGQVVTNSGDKQASIENGMWWLNLPFVMAILLRRSSESEVPDGLYSLKMDDGSPSHIVLFENQRDASNFCHILEAFFEELSDLSADVVPLSIKELKDELQSSPRKIIVLQKGQLKLYAGQPLADVERTLRTLVR